MKRLMITLFTTADAPRSAGTTVVISGTAKDVRAQLDAIEARPGFVKWSRQSSTGRG